MESLAVLVAVLFIVEIALGIVAIIFSALYRRNHHFKKTTVVLMALLAIQTVWALSLSPAFGFPPLLCLAIASLIRFLPIRPR